MSSRPPSLPSASRAGASTSVSRAAHASAAREAAVGEVRELAQALLEGARQQVARGDAQQPACTSPRGSHPSPDRSREPEARRAADPRARGSRPDGARSRRARKLLEPSTRGSAARRRTSSRFPLRSRALAGELFEALRAEARTRGMQQRRRPQGTAVREVGVARGAQEGGRAGLGVGLADASQRSGIGVPFASPARKRAARASIGRGRGYRVPGGFASGRPVGGAQQIHLREQSHHPQALLPQLDDR